MSMIDRSFACTFFRSTVQLARGGGHAQGYNQSTGYFFGEKASREAKARMEARGESAEYKMQE
ncbi:hypothetical protein BGZ59_009803 [Podila verticillata]|nr:hypothetical protein BGZ59_009803 [Podila verticillata]